MWFARPFLKLCGFESCPFSAVWITSLGCVAVVFVSLTAAVLIELRIRTDNFQRKFGLLCFFSCMQQSWVEKYVLKTYITRWWEKEDWNSWGEGWNSLDYENSLSCPLLGERLKLKKLSQSLLSMCTFQAPIHVIRAVLCLTRPDRRLTSTTRRAWVRRAWAYRKISLATTFYKRGRNCPERSTPDKL